MSLTAADYKKYIHWGTSTWTFEGWKNQVYFKEYENERHFKTATLEEYCAFPLFGIIGMDLWYYRQPTASDLQEYVPYIPVDFPIGIKVVNTITTFRWPRTGSASARSGAVNLHFLDAKQFIEEFLPPFEAVFSRLNLIFIFEFSAIAATDLPGGVGEFAGMLDAFLQKLPPRHRYAVEIRNKNFIDARYFDILKKYRVSHCYNQWAHQHAIGKQFEIGKFTADFVVVRALQPPKWSHTQSEQFFKPYNQIKLILPEVRQDILNLVRAALLHQIEAYIIVNNRLEGNAPGTIRELDEMVYQYLLSK